MRRMFECAIMYSQPMRNWKLKRNCKTADFLKGCLMWRVHNDKDDMPLKNDKRFGIPKDRKKTWRSK
jgi:hypothetical protein